MKKNISKKILKQFFLINLKIEFTFNYLHF